MRTLNYGPRVGWFAFQDPTEDRRYNILTGAVRSGKTWALHPKILRLCKYPVTGWRILTGQSKESIYNNVLNDLFSLIGPSAYHYNSQSGLLRIGKAYWKVMGAKDEGSEKFLRGSTVGAFVCDELTLTPQNFFEMMLTRMSPEGARFYATTNCDSPLHWLKKWMDDQHEKKTGELLNMHLTMDDNPNLPADFKKSIKSTFRGVFYERFILGLWVMAEGSIYRDSWSDDLLFDDSTMPLGLLNQGGYKDRWVSVDAGVDHPQVYLEFYDDGETIWVPKEYFWDSRKEQRQKTDGQYADDMSDFMGANRACEIIVPPECASLEAEFKLRGWWVREAENEVDEGIKTVAGMMTNRKIRIHRRCVNLRKQLETYIWDQKAALRGIEQPLKQLDDGPDCLRYGVHRKIPKWRFSGY